MDNIITDFDSEAFMENLIWNKVIRVLIPRTANGSE